MHEGFWRQGGFASSRQILVAAKGRSICYTVYAYVESAELAASSQQTDQTSIKLDSYLKSG